MLPKPKRLLIAYPASRVGDITLLCEAYQQVGIQTTMQMYSGKPQSAAIESTLLNQADAMLLVGDSRFAPGTVSSGPFITDQTGRRIPFAWLPVKNQDGLIRFAQTIRLVHSRGRQVPGLAMLGQWHPRYLQLSDRVESILKDRVHTFRWTSDVISRSDLVSALGSGLGMSLYVGHGRPIGWVGYYGMRAHHFDTFSGSPIGCVLSLCCRTASRRRTALSYAEALPVMGVAAAAFGAVKETRHTDNTRWIVRICESLLQGADNLADLLLRSAPANLEAIQHYRIIGDPFAPLYSDLAGMAKAKAVMTYP
ncbi:MAG: C25 family cysteine peptidase [Saprospiraceae bacterium]